MLTPYFELSTVLSLGSVTPIAAAGDNNGSVYTYDSGGTIKKIDLVNGYLTSYSETPSTANISGILFVNSSSALLMSSTSNQVELLDVAGQYNTTQALATGLSWTSHKSQQMAVVGDISLFTNSTSRISKFVTSTRTASTITPAWLTTTIGVVIGKPDTGTFLVGSSTGVVVEIDGSGNVIGGLTLPTTPNDGTAPTHVVVNLAYYSDILVAATLSGLLFTYQWSTKTLLNRGFCYTNTSNNSSAGFGGSAGGGGLTMCEAPSGVLVCGVPTDNAGSGSVFQSLFLGSISASGFDYEDYITTSSVGQKVIATGIDTTYNIGWAMMRTTTAGHFQIFTIPSGELTPVDFRAQYPLGFDVAFRNIIIKYNGPGRSRVIDDRSLAAGVTSLNLRRNARYIAIAINGTNYDFRGIDT